MSAPPGADGVHVRFRENNGRLVISELYVHATEITPEILQRLSLRRLEAELNAAPCLKPGQRYSEFSAAVMADFLRSCGDGTPEPSLADLRERARHQNRQQSEEPRRSRLTRPNGTVPEEFYPRVAAAYRQYAQLTRAPAKMLSAEAGVPVTTAHRWIREARRRGILAPARKGKAG